MKIGNFPAPNGGIIHFKQCHRLVFKKLTRESAALDIKAMASDL
jgi:hypothetical protein